jgi:cation transport regulator ChaB
LEDTMTYQTDSALPPSLLEQLAAEGLGVLPELIRRAINAAMQIERQKHLGVKPLPAVT